MAIPEAEIKILWGRAAGRCSNPACRTDLTAADVTGNDYLIGEMAHVIAKQPGGPRGKSGGGLNTYDNLILLCPSCHTRIDKAPLSFGVDILRKWKSDHEEEIRQQGLRIEITSMFDLKREVTRLLIENHSIWLEFGPKSNTAILDPNSNLHTMWTLKKLSRIVPNNRKIINMIEANYSLLFPKDQVVYFAFKNHAEAFERHQYCRLDKYPLFPKEFEEVFKS